MAARSIPRRGVEKLDSAEASDGPAALQDRRCAYCVPLGGRGRASDEMGAECLIKMLGKAERKQVSLTLYRQGHGTGLFTRQCPMSAARTFDACPFYEDEDEIPEE